MSDISTAYDRIEWKYLQALLLALGFSKKWVAWIIFCVTSVTYYVFINAQVFGMITPQRILRQGDPMSSFLFLLCTESLTHILNKVEARREISGIRFSKEGPAIYHLLFEDDSMFLCRAEVAESIVLNMILNEYDAAKGQKINLNKFFITFRAKIEKERKAELQNELSIVNEGGIGTYLGLPECFSGYKVKFLLYKLQAKV